MSMFWETRWPIQNSGGHGTKNTNFLASDLQSDDANVKLCARPIWLTVQCIWLTEGEKVKNTPTSEKSYNLENKVTQMKSIHICAILLKIYITAYGGIQHVTCQELF